MRRLTAEEQRLWARVVESVRPIGPGFEAEAEVPAAAAPKAPARRPAAISPAPAPAARRPGPGATLDGSWDRRLARGLVQPDALLDLHGHDLAAAYASIDRRLEEAIAAGARLLLLVTGRAPAAGRTAGRGAIRAAVGDWLAASRHSDRIAAVRGAHPRHGGTGALYIVLRRPRPRGDTKS
jgi:DNA-nicking Smr family endonuclease